MSSDNDRPLYTRRRVIGLGAAALGAAAAGRVIPAYGAQGSAIDSYNWSGARVHKDVLNLLFPPPPSPPNPPDHFFTSVKATWKVPKVQRRHGDSDLRSAAWVGLDGATWGLPDTPSQVKVLQAGTYHYFDKPTSKPMYFAFFGLDLGNPNATDVYLNFSQFEVDAGDTIAVNLNYDNVAGSATVDFKGTSSVNYVKNPAPLTISTGSITGYTVEWVFERISLNNDSSFGKDYHKAYYSLGNHDAVVFSNAEAVTNQGHSVSPDDGDTINMRDVDDWPTLLTGGAALSGEVQIKRR